MKAFGDDTVYLERVVEDVVRGQWSPRDVDRVMQQTAALDGVGVSIREEQEPGSAGKAVEGTARPPWEALAVQEDARVVGEPCDRHATVTRGEEPVPLLQRRELLQRQRVDLAQQRQVAFRLVGPLLLGRPVERHRRGVGGHEVTRSADRGALHASSAAGDGDRARDRRSRQGLPLYVEPGHRDRRRDRDGVARRLPGVEHGVHAVPPDLPLQSRGQELPDHRGGARRGRAAQASRDRPSLHAGL